MLNFKTPLIEYGVIWNSKQKLEANLTTARTNNPNYIKLDNPPPGIKCLYQMIQIVQFCSICYRIRLDNII